MNRLVVLGISILITGCAVPPIDRVNSVQGYLGTGYSPMWNTPVKREWDECIVRDQSFWNRWHYTWTCLTRYSQGRGWGDQVTNQ